MPNLNLIILDGLPGSGKTTTGRWLTAQLQQNGSQARWLPEAAVPHPLWWYDYWDGSQYLPPDFVNTPIEAHIQNSLQRWRDFVRHVKATEITVGEAFILQNTVGIFLMGGAQPDHLLVYTRQVQAIIRSLNPVLIYFYQADVAAALQQICQVRGPEFEAELLKNMESFPYLQQRNLTGLAGVATLWQAIRDFTDQIVAESTIRTLAVENSAGDWPAYRRQILKFLGLPFAGDRA